MRINYIWRNICPNRPMAFGRLLLAVGLIICTPPTNMQAEEVISANSNEVKAPCKGLKPYNNFDELLYQFYINLDSDCIFLMSLSELEEVWATEIWGFDMDRKRAMSEQAYREFARKPCDTNRGAFIIEANRIQGPSINGKLLIDRFVVKPAMGCSKEKGGILGHKSREEDPFKMLPPLKKIFYLWSWYSSDYTRRITFHRGRPGGTMLSHILVSRTPEKQLDILISNQGE